MVTKTIDNNAVVLELARVVEKHGITYGMAEGVFGSVIELFKQQTLSLGEDKYKDSVGVYVNGLHPGDSQINIMVAINGPVPVNDVGYVVAERVRSAIESGLVIMTRD